LLLLAPLAAVAQQSAQMHTVGVLAPHRDDAAYPALADTLRRLGYQPGKNLRLLERSAERKLERLPALAKELTDARPAVIVAINTPGARAAIDAAAGRIPIVMCIVGDPVATGFVSNVARPGGNVTGISNLTGELAGKRLALLQEAVPRSRRIAVLLNPADPITLPQVRDLERVAPSLGAEVRFFPVKAPEDLPETFRQMLAWRADAALWLSGQGVAYQPGTIKLAAQHRLPVMVTQRSDVEAGGLMSYFPDHNDLFSRCAVYVDRILKGAKPGDLPIELPTKFDLAINLKTAKAIGLAIPQSVLVRADYAVK
jgi:putative ABC transport system substrate-binding protein